MKSLIVTGGANGLGRSIAQSASDAGYRVGIIDVNIDALEDAASSIQNTVPLIASVTSSDEIAAALDKFGTIPDIWVNNAGIVKFGPLLELPVDDWRAVVEVNLTGTFICSTIVAEAMALRGSGSIINITSINGISAGTNSGAYGATKSAISLLTAALFGGPAITHRSCLGSEACELARDSHTTIGRLLRNQQQESSDSLTKQF